MNNVAEFSLDDLRSIAGDAADHISNTISIRGVSTDSRTLEPGNAFVALRGEVFNGHEHVRKALQQGAVVAIVEQEYFDNADAGIRERLLPCTDTLTALGVLANYHRRRFDIPVIAIAGAAGKTSTKELVTHVLGSVYNVHATKANYNNRVGTPLTLLGLAPEHDVAVIEIGTNEPGEIQDLSAMVMPTMGLITNIGKEHLEKLIDLDGVEKEETALFDFLDQSQGLLLVNVDDKRLRKYAVPTASPVSSLRVVSFGIDFGGNIHPTIEFDEQLHPTLHVSAGAFTFRATMKSQGLAAARNAVAAMAIAWSMGMSAADTRAALQSFEPRIGHGYARLVVQPAKGFVVLNDTYNANPESMHIALQTLQRYPASMRISVLGDMRELGEAEAAEHDQVLQFASASSSNVIVFGRAFAHSALRLQLHNVQIAESHEQCALRCLELIHSNRQQQPAAILIKGSRGLTMERVVHIVLESGN